ncbi:MAG: PAS domain S-box protein [Deltaproteobacteria bacterium]|nr:PAS domain S-box protein [Deltaproteobacteria bacterium]
MEPSPAQFPLFAALPFAAGLICTALALAILSRDPGDRTVRANAIFLLAPGWWAFFEVLALLAPDAETAHTAYLISTPGWTLIPPLALYVIGCVVNEKRDGLFSLATKLSFALSIGFTLLNWKSHALTAGVMPTPWGFNAVPGPVFPVYAGFTMLAASGGIWRWMRAIPDQAVLGDERASRGVMIGFIAPISVGCATDVILPLLGIDVPRLGSTSFGFLALVVLYLTVRRGFMFATPGSFAQQILETLPDGVALISPDGSIRFANAGLERSTGVDALRLTGAAIRTFIPRPALGIGCDMREVESELISVTGERIPISLSSTTITDRQGSELGVALLFRDIRELKSLRSRLITSGRLAAVGQLAAGIAHEINNPLAFVRSNLGQLREHWGTLEKGLEQRSGPELLSDVLAEGEEIIDESLEGIDRAAGIVREVREFSHAGHRERELADLNELMDQVIRVAAPEIATAISIDRDYGELPPILCSPQQLKQVFLNLTINAIHAVGGSGAVMITTRAEGNQIRVWIDDDGCGIPDNLIERIFDPFFTTKEVGQGTGLGLSISHEIIRGHGGEIVVEPKAEVGTRFAVTLPLTNDPDPS